MGGETGGGTTPPAADPTPGLTNISATLSGTIAWAGCVVENPAYIKNGEVVFHFTSSSHTTSATYNVGSTQTYAQVSNVQLNTATTYNVYASCTASNGSTVTSESCSLTVLIRYLYMTPLLFPTSE